MAGAPAELTAAHRALLVKQTVVFLTLPTPSRAARLSGAAVVR